MRIPLVTTVIAIAAAISSVSAQADILESKGKLTFLRVHDVGSGWGAEPDVIDGEVIIKLDTEPDYKAFGFKLRNDANLAAHQGMIDLLRDAFNNNWTVTINYDIAPGRKNGEIFRVWITKELVGIGPDLAIAKVPNAAAGFEYCRHSGGNGVVSVRNQGNVQAGASTTTVEFFETGVSGTHPVHLATPALQPGQSVELQLGRSCTQPDCHMIIAVDSKRNVVETEEFNNTRGAQCG